MCVMVKMVKMIIDDALTGCVARRCARVGAGVVRTTICGSAEE